MWLVFILNSFGYIQDSVIDFETIAENTCNKATITDEFEQCSVDVNDENSCDLIVVVGEESIALIRKTESCH
jgi:hypothetical protein